MPGKTQQNPPRLPRRNSPRTRMGMRRCRRTLRRCRGWKSDAGYRLDALIVPNAMRWNSSWYGIEGQGWFLSCHCFAEYTRFVFLLGKQLDPHAPVDHKDTRYFHTYEDGEFDEERGASWVRHAAELP